LILPPAAATRRGIVMGRLRSPQRNLEVSLMRFCLQKLGEWVEL
jgi:arginine deiminase